MTRNTARRLLLILSAWLLFGGLVCLSQAQVPMTGAGKGVPGGTVGYQGPGDIVSGATAWWGLRGYNAAYVGNAANICTPLDAVCLDVTIVAGALNTTTLGTLACNNLTTICTIKTLYDQSGTNSCGGSPCNLAQATIASRPTYVAPGAANGCPTTTLSCMSFVSGVASLTNAGFGSISQPFSISLLFNRTANQAQYQNYFVGSDASHGIFGENVANSIFMSVGVSLATATAADAVFHAGQFVFDNSGGSHVYLDGVNNSVSLGSSSAWPTGTIFFGADGVRNCTPFVAFEIGFWPLGFSGGNAISLNAQQHSLGGGW